MAEYPAENSKKMRVDEHKVTRGGNSGNSLTVLTQLYPQCKCYFMGALGTDEKSTFIKKDMSRYSIDHSLCPIYPDPLPTSYIVLSKATGSRTILHHRGSMPEVSADVFQKQVQQALGRGIRFDHIHFEGRHVSETWKKMQWLLQMREKQTNDSESESASEQRQQQRSSSDKDKYQRCRWRPTISVEAENVRAAAGAIGKLIKHADLVFFSKEFMQHQGKQYQSFDNGDQFLLDMCLTGRVKHGAVAVVTGGEKGARAIHFIDNQSRPILCASFDLPNKKVVDTLGAGDTFNGAFICAYLKGWSLEKTLRFAVEVSGRKCYQYGFSGLGKAISESWKL